MAPEFGPRDFVLLNEGREYGIGELAASADELPRIQAGLIGISVPDGPLTAAALLWVQREQLDSLLFHGETAKSRTEELARRFGCSHLLTGTVGGGNVKLTVARCDTRSALKERSRSITLLTSGTSGEPKRVLHTWESLRTSVVTKAELHGARWMSLYPLTRFAGFNTLLHAIYNDSALIVPSSYGSLDTVAEIQRTGATHVSGTPTLWRSLLMAGPGTSGAFKSLRQITIGGEVVDQQILNALASAAPHARLTHIYASTEFGVCLAVSDGLAGFPEQWLENPEKRVQLKVLHGQLWIKPNEATWVGDLTIDNSWIETRDLAEVRDGRVFIKGRATDVLNVGGGKILPAEVEERLLEVPGIMAARVTGQRSSLSGAIVTAEIVGAPGMNEATLRAAVISHCRACLPAFAVPRMISFTDSLPATASGKASRDFGLGI